MNLWKNCSENKAELDVKQLIKMLKTIANQKNVEVIQLALQSVLEELGEQRS